MNLLLQIVGDRAVDLGRSSRKVFAHCGGTIGRSPDCDWIVPDPFVSGHHARIRFCDGHYLLEDTSANGVFVNSRTRRLAEGEQHVLSEGDRLFIDDYEIEVRLLDPQTDPELLTERLAPPSSGAAQSFTRDPVLTLPLKDPSDAVIEALMPPDYDPLPQPRAHAADTPSAHEAPEEEVDLTTLLVRAGLPQSQITPELSKNLGQVLEVIVRGLLGVLRAREEVKLDLGMHMTTFKPVDNNPLKFSANVEDALHNLFVKHNAAYLTPADAFEDALREIRDHQTAMHGAVKETLREMLAAFEPHRLEQEFDRQEAGMSIFWPTASRYWRAYREKFARLGRDPDGALRAFFGEKLAVAYERQRVRLQASGSSDAHRERGR